MGLAERYWWRDANSSVASQFNLGLFYSLDIVSREADAIDTWRRALKNSLDYEPAKKSLANVLPNVLKRAAAARSFGPTLLLQKQWFRSYIGPIRLLGPEAENDVCSLDAKAIQKLKKAVLREIEFGDGKIAWVEGLVLDRSRGHPLDRRATTGEWCSRSPPTGRRRSTLPTLASRLWPLGDGNRPLLGSRHRLG
jgi:hypothetical protein